MPESPAVVMRQLHDEHAAALWGFCLRLTGGDRRSGGGRRAGDAAPRVAQRRGAREVAGLGPGLAVHRRPQHRHRRVAHQAVPAASSPWPRSPTWAGPTTRPTSCCSRGWSPRRSPSCPPTTAPCSSSATTGGSRWPRPLSSLGVPEGTVKSRTHYALRALRLALEEMGVGRMSCEFAHHDGAYVLGSLSPADRSAFERHLAGCADCALGVRELAGLPGLLAQGLAGRAGDRWRTRAGAADAAPGPGQRGSPLPAAAYRRCWWGWPRPQPSWSPVARWSR